MKDVFARLGADFFSTILFIAIYLATDNVLLATGVAIAGAIAQVIYSRVKGKELGYMTWASLALVIVLGSATLLTHDPRFVLAKPAIGHFAIGVIMLKRGWMLRYMPAIVTQTIPEYVTFAGYAWAALCFALRASLSPSWWPTVQSGRAGGHVMAIYRLMQHSDFAPEDVQRIGAAYERALVELGLKDRNDPLTEIVAKVIIEIAQTGEKDFHVICDAALKRINSGR